MKTNQINHTNFQSRIIYSQGMSKAEKRYARKILNFKFVGERISTNKQLLKKYDLDLLFKGSTRFDPPSVGFTPQFTIFDPTEGFKTVKPVSKRAYIGESYNQIWIGANRLREVISDSNKNKNNYDKDMICNSFFKKIAILLKCKKHK